MVACILVIAFKNNKKFISGICLHRSRGVFHESNTQPHPARIFRVKFVRYAVVSNQTPDLTLARTLCYHSAYDMLRV
jgi:hypothetical protein